MCAYVHVCMYISPSSLIRCFGNCRVQPAATAGPLPTPDTSSVIPSKAVSSTWSRHLPRRILRCKEEREKQLMPIPAPHVASQRRGGETTLPAPGSQALAQKWEESSVYPLAFPPEAWGLRCRVAVLTLGTSRESCCFSMIL